MNPKELKVSELRIGEQFFYHDQWYEVLAPSKNKQIRCRMLHGWSGYEVYFGKNTPVTVYLKLG